MAGEEKPLAGKRGSRGGCGSFGLSGSWPQRRRGGGVWPGEGEDPSVVGGGCVVYEGEWLRVFFQERGGGCVLMTVRGRVCGRLKREDQMAKGGAAACSMFFPQKRGGGCGSGRKSLGLGLGFFFCFPPHFLRASPLKIFLLFFSL